VGFGVGLSRIFGGDGVGSLVGDGGAQRAGLDSAYRLDPLWGCSGSLEWGQRRAHVGFVGSLVGDQLDLCGESVGLRMAWMWPLGRLLCGTVWEPLGFRRGPSWTFVGESVGLKVGFGVGLSVGSFVG
jgi:hypothetical protein